MYQLFTLRFQQGLEEVHLNLSESQDFFQASLDGRLRKYHQIEKVLIAKKCTLIYAFFQDIIEAQLKALEEFPPVNPRKQQWDEELQKDLDFVSDSIHNNTRLTSIRFSKCSKKR